MSYSWDKFLRPLAGNDTNVQIMDNNGTVTYTINPYTVINVFVKNNLVNVSLKSGRVISIPFSSLNEAKLALPRIKQLFDALQKKAPIFVSNEIKNYVNSVNIQFFYQDNIPNGTGTDSIRTGSFWYDSDYGYLYVYIYDGAYYQWVTAAGEVGPVGATGPAGPTGPDGPQGNPFQLNGTVSGTSSLPEPSVLGNAYVDDLDGHLWVYGQSGWVDGGSILGPAGTSGTSGLDGTSGTSGKDGQSTSYFFYEANTSVISGNPNPGFISWNNSTQINSTYIYVNMFTSDVTDVDNFISLYREGQEILIQDRYLSEILLYPRLITGSLEVPRGKVTSL